jgi:hypothetical protein
MNDEKIVDLAKVNLLECILEEQKKYHELIDKRVRLKYPSQTERLWAYTQAMQAEVGEIHRELKPLWSWWRENSANKWVYNLTMEEKEKLIEERIDIWKFLNEFFIELGVGDPLMLYLEYMKKHEVINQRLKDEGIVKQSE